MSKIGCFDKGVVYLPLSNPALSARRPMEDKGRSGVDCDIEVASCLATL